MIFAICSDNENFKNDRLREKLWSRRFPGSGWVTCLYDESMNEDFEVASGDVALKNIQEGKWSTNDVYVIQDLISSDASKLIILGAKPFVITCYEASIYAPYFYENINEISKPFRYKMGYGFEDNELNDNSYATNRFPSFYTADVLDIHGWISRKEISIVAGNKYRAKNIYLPAKPSVLSLMRQVKHYINQIKYKKYGDALGKSLHVERLKAIEYFCTHHKIDIYGGGWGQWDEHPAYWVGRLSSLVKSSYQGQCLDKISTISNYRFNLCYENMMEKGYVTEKIIECFVASTIPIYLGASDIEKYIPEKKFIDKRKFDLYEDMTIHMERIEEAEAVSMILAGREFLNSEEGRLHSYEGFAQNIISMGAAC